MNCTINYLDVSIIVYLVVFKAKLFVGMLSVLFLVIEYINNFQSHSSVVGNSLNKPIRDWIPLSCYSHRLNYLLSCVSFEEFNELKRTEPFHKLWILFTSMNKYMYVDNLIEVSAVRQRGPDFPGQWRYTENGGHQPNYFLPL